MTTLPPVVLSEPAVLDLTGYRGDTHRFRVTITEGGLPLDVSAAEWDADIRETADGTLVGVMVVTPVVGQTNMIDVELPASLEEGTLDESDTGPFVGVWDLEMRLGEDPDVTVTTILRGQITLTRDVSRAPLVAVEGEGPETPAVLRGASPLLGLERVGGPEAPEVHSIETPS